MQSTTVLPNTRKSMSALIPDHEHRTRALDPAQSFIVQAPAGSGKTELLTQRFLILLGSVKQPEEILAITFTKKSAAEMRTRIIHALKNAAFHDEPESAHAKTTYQLAKKVLRQDKALDWFLLENPNRLRIQTIDAFNSYLTRQLPVLSQFGSSPEITDNAKDLYQQAVNEFLTHLEENVEWSDSIATLLLHLDNDLDKLQELLIALLAKRDQWLPYITLNITDPMLRENLEASLASVFSDVLTTLLQSIPEQYVEELLQLVRHAAKNVVSEKPDSPIIACADLEDLPGIEYHDKKLWLGLQELLFTKTGDWRRSITKDIGFFAPSSYKNAEEKAKASDIKNRMSDLLSQLCNHDEIKSAFSAFKCAPDIFYQEDQWKTLEALHQVLRIVVAQLKIIFQQHSKIDYIENSQAALTALGSEDTPTDLTLALDYQIKHILIDEFQDTSNSQYRLLEKLISGWEQNDGRTLFLVGDPMQSIYRFREAEVGLFIRARTHGIGNVHLIPLTLSVNFRSVPGIVNWVNAKFPHVFPSFEDIASGAVSYSASIANKEDASEPAVKLSVCSTEDEFQQASQIVELIKERKRVAPAETIAILVRARPQLTQIIRALKSAHLPYRAIDIDPLTARPFIQDLMALTRALLHPADRIAWLAVLRAPWCGLTLSDLLMLSGNDGKISLLERLDSTETLHTLSHDGQQRLQRVFPILKAKLQERRRTTLRNWVESTWLLLGGAACVEQENDLADAANYFNLLDNLDVGGDLANLDALNDSVEKLFASPDHRADETLQIMTIHNSKGLEFDTVILPHLERKASNDDKQLMLWMERPRSDESSDLLLAPMHAIGNDNDTVYEYIKQQQSEKNNYEKSRLLYVAVTRAKKQLHLFFNLKEDKKAAPNSLLEKLWPAIKNEIPEVPAQQETSKITCEETSSEQPIKRLPSNWQTPIHENRLAENFARHKKTQGFLLPDNHHKQTGIMIHQILQQISMNGIAWWQSQSVQNQQHYINNHLSNLDMLKADITLATPSVLTAIQKTLADKRGQWILQPHSEAASELPLTALIDGVATPMVIDRTFVDENNVRWIIDYKSAIDTEGDLEKFLMTQQKEYQNQLWHYFQAIQEQDSREIKVGLYFPLIPAWKEVIF